MNSSSTPPTLDDGLLAAILAVGLEFGVISKPDAIAWADQEIARRADVPSWLINLSMANSEQFRNRIIASSLGQVSWSADKQRLCTGLYSLVPDLSTATYDQCSAIAKSLYQMVRSVLKGDFSSPTLLEMMDVYERFEGWAMFTMSREELIELLRQFVDKRRDQAIRSRLQPVEIILPKDAKPA
jgi:hypothetical protein